MSADAEGAVLELRVVVRSWNHYIPGSVELNKDTIEALRHRLIADGRARS